MNAEMVRGSAGHFEANEAFRFRNIGNAAGLKLTLNGRPFPRSATDGEVIKNLIFDRDASSTRSAPARRIPRPSHERDGPESSPRRPSSA